MPSPHCYGSLQVCATRIAALEANGQADPGASNGYISSDLIQADISLEIEEGDEFIVKSGCGNICQTFRDCDRIKRATIAIELCVLDSEMISLMVQNGTLFTDAGTGDAIGFELPAFDVDCPNGVSVEFWSKAWDGTAQATPPFLGGSVAYYHWVFPKVRWQLGDLTLENEILRIPLNGIAEENPNISIDGPFNDWNVDVAAAGGITNVGGWFLDDTLPTAECGFVTVPAAS